jgi:hypothetical protein
MDRATGNFDAVLQGLSLRVQPGEGREQGRMNIQNLKRKFTHEPGAEQAHESRQANQIHFRTSQFLGQHAVINFAVQALGGNADGMETALTRHFQTARFRAIGNHDGDFRIQAAGGDVVRDGFEVGAASGKQNSKSLLHR